MTEPDTQAGAAPTSASAPQEGRCSTTDGLKLHWRSWLAREPSGVIVIVHGLAEHGGRYRETAEAFATRGWAVYAGDLRGHGVSPNPRGARRVHVDRFTDYYRDVDSFVALARQRHPGLPLFLLGHSMGGLITLSYVLDRPEGLAGAVISSPALGVHPGRRPPRLLRLLVSLLERVAPRLRFPNDLDTDGISRDPSVVRAYREDPLVSNRVSARWYAEIIRAMGRAHEKAGSLRIPVLLMQSGADRLVDPAAPARWSQTAPAGQVEFVNWNGLYHEMFNEPEKQQVRSRTLDWLRQRVAEPPAS